MSKPDEKIISAALSEDIKNIKIHTFETIGSTNTALKELGSGGAEEGTTLIASSQTGGRGRYGRSFFSPGGTGVYLSTLIRPTSFASFVDRVTSIAAVAASEAIESVFPELKAGIKWVNDIFIGSKKVCGILSEVSFTSDGRPDYAVVGVGMNIFPPKGGFPPEIDKTAGYLSQVRKENAAELLSAAFLNGFYYYYRKLPDCSYQKKYENRCFVIGKNVEIVRPSADDGNVESARVIALDDECRLVVEHTDGRLETLSSGEVRLKSWQTEE